MKICKKCNRSKPLYGFYKNNNTKDGHISCCKVCYRQISNLYNRLPETIEQKRQWTIRNRKRLNAMLNINYHKNPLKTKARAIISDRIRRGKLPRSPCRICGDIKAQAHHSDYNKPLEIAWLCFKHHRAWHRVFMTEQDRFSEGIF